MIRAFSKKVFFVLALLMVGQVNAEFVGKSERAAVTVTGLLSVYASKCGDLTPLGDRMFLLVAKAQEDKGLLLPNIAEFKEGVDKFNGFIQRDGLSETCSVIRKAFKSMPIWNKAIE
jgi:hypothetical protein